MLLLFSCSFFLFPQGTDRCDALLDTQGDEVGRWLHEQRDRNDDVGDVARLLTHNEGARPYMSSAADLRKISKAVESAAEEFANDDAAAEPVAS